MISKNRKGLASKVFANREKAGNAEKYDITSYDEFGNIKYIEVKATTGDLNKKFRISENEVEFANNHKENYYLYRVYNLSMKNKTYNLEIIKGEINREKLEPTNYSLQIREV